MDSMHIMKKIGMAVVAIGMLVAGCTSSEKESDWTEQAIANARAQIGLEIDTIEASGQFLNPVTLTKEGGVYYCNYADWRSGFFPGSVWYLYELTGDTALIPLARKYTEAISEAQNLTWHHDIGFIINCSFGNALRLAPKPADQEVLLQAAKSLCTRFRKQPQVIQSWDVSDNSWQAQRGWECPVIIDNMMNLELLFKATRLSGDSTYYHIAVTHADRTLKEHFRPDGSCYHVVDYSLTDGSVRHRQTAQGYADESVWSRGHAWAIYGYTLCYRETKDPKYLNRALETFDFLRHHPRMPEDGVPYWDMDAPNIPNEPRDVSSAAIIASALYELYIYTHDESLCSYADHILQSLATPAYTAPLGENGRFILMHSVGSIPHNSEINVPLNYADYYYLEALVRKLKLR